MSNKENLVSQFVLRFFPLDSLSLDFDSIKLESEEDTTETEIVQNHRVNKTKKK